MSSPPRRPREEIFVENFDSLDDLAAGKPPQPQPDWDEEDIRHRQQSLFPDPWKELEPVLDDFQEDAGLEGD